MDVIVEKLKKEDLLVFDDGRYIMWAPGVEIPLTGKCSIFRWNYKPF